MENATLLRDHFNEQVHMKTLNEHPATKFVVHNGK